MTWWVYILRCKNGSLYTGITPNIWRRIHVHLQGKGAKYTRAHRPIFLVYSRQERSRSAAAKREATFKRMTKANKEELVRLNGVKIKLI